MKNLPPIFKAYDIRGVYPNELNEEIAYKVGNVFAQFLNAEELGVIGDYRISTPALKKKLVEGMVDAGSDVIDLGYGPTPLMYFSVVKLNIDGGVAVTASHNPPEYNGFKLTREKAIPVYAENGIYEIGRMVVDNRIKRAEKKGNIQQKNMVEEYIKDAVSRISLGRTLEVVVDTGNGACVDIPEKILKSLGCRVKTIFKEPNGKFPNHIADPLKVETLKWLREEVVRENADLGIAFDGDGDRVGLVDEKGNVVSQDHILMMLVKQALERRKGYVVFEVRTSRAVINFAEELGGKPIITRVGHAYIVDEIMKRNAVFGGELSGHIYLPYCYYPFDDGIFAAMKLVEFVSNLDEPLSKFVEKLPAPITTPEIHIKVKEEDKWRIMDAFREELEKRGYDINTLDGVRVDFEDGWGIVRPSNTEPMIKCRFEAESEEALERIKDDIMSILEDVIKRFEG